MTQNFRCVLVGCGQITNAWIPSIGEMTGVELVGLVDLNPEAATQLAKVHGLGDIATGTDLEAMLDRLRPDVVLNCTVPSAHRSVTLAALERGCHVLGEKPLASSMADAREMLQAARKHGRVFAVLQNRRFDPNLRRLRRFLDSGAIGQVHTVHCDFFVGVHFGGFRDEMEHVLLLDMAIHTFDAARALVPSVPVGVYCHEWNPAASWYRHGASAVAIFEMDGGRVFNYRGSWCAEGMHTAWEASWRIIGERGTVLWDGGENIVAERVVEPGVPSRCESVALPPLEPKGPQGHAACIRHFFECLENGGAVETDCADNIHSLAMVFGAIDSAESGHRVALSPPPRG